PARHRDAPDPAPPGGRVPGRAFRPPPRAPHRLLDERRREGALPRRHPLAARPRAPRLLGAQRPASAPRLFAADGPVAARPPPPTPPRASPRLAEELRAVEAFAARALALPKDAKALCLVEAVRRVGELAAKGEGSGKVVIFTESLTTQGYLRRLLVDSGVRDH